MELALGEQGQRQKPDADGMQLIEHLSRMVGIAIAMTMSCQTDQIEQVVSDVGSSSHLQAIYAFYYTNQKVSELSEQDEMYYLCSQTGSK